jgi:hypothetical protein
VSMGYFGADVSTPIDIQYSKWKVGYFHDGFSRKGDHDAYAERLLLVLNWHSLRWPTLLKISFFGDRARKPLLNCLENKICL